MRDDSRGRIFYIFLFFVFLFFLYKLIDLQLIKHGQYDRFAEENAARITPIRAPRGIIYDRSGNIIVHNRPVFSLVFFPEKTEDYEEELVLLSQKLNIPVQELKRKISSSSDPGYMGIRLANNLSPSEVSKIKEAEEKLAGAKIMVSPLREYPDKKAGIHILGYIGEINQRELEANKDFGYRPGELIGKDGVEKEYDRYLRGVAGGEKLEVDAFGRPIRLMESLDPVPGNNLKLTIDQEMQRAVEEIFGWRKGAVVVIDPRNGEILSMVSGPSYDPTVEWEKIDQRNNPFMNRAISAYPAGSVFKPVVLQAAIDGSKFNAGEQITCKGFIKMGARIARCWRAQGHGRIGFIEGLVWSCDVAFYELGLRLGWEKISEYARQFGLGEKTGIDLPHEKNGLVPSEEWKKKVYRQPWYEGDTINYAIGQGFLLVTPLQMANLYAEIATGKRFSPYIVKEVITPDGEKIYSAVPRQVLERNISEGLRQSLRETVRRGTGVGANFPGLPAAGKTGTAENPGRAHAWFCSYAPYDNPEIVISVFVEHGEHGDQAPAQITRKILEWHKKFRFKREILPEKPTYQYIDHGSYNQWIYPKSYYTATAEAF